MPNKPFIVHRVGPRGPDTYRHLFCAMAVGNHELVRTKESPEYALINGASGSIPADSRKAVQRLVDELNAVWDRYLAGEFHD